MSYLTDLLGSAYHEGMTEEEISSALELLQSGHDDDVTSLKRQLSKANAEAKTYKDKFREKLSADDKRKAEQEDELNNLRATLDELKEQNATLTKNLAFNSNKEKFVAMGYKPELAQKAAQAVVDGNTDALMEVNKAFIEAHDSDLKTELMKGMGKPSAGSTGGPTMTKEALMKMSTQERVTWAMNNENEYTKIMGE